jgi:hypothetical protein
MAAVGALGSTARLGCLVRLSTQLGRECASKHSLFKNNLRLLSHTLALITPAYDRREDDVASTFCGGGGGDGSGDGSGKGKGGGGGRGGCVGEGGGGGVVSGCGSGGGGGDN